MERSFSIIIPAFNSENYIKCALESIKKQSYSNYEIIVVNDGSNDETESITKKFFNDNSYIKGKLINISHSGLSQARNIGIDAAEGDYICNLDSDDFLESEVLKKINEINFDFDICFYGFQDIDEKNKRIITKYNDKYSYLPSPITGVQAAILKLKKNIWICQGNAVYRTALIKENKIYNVPEIIQGEDFYFIMRSLFWAKKVCNIQYIGMNYLRRNNSIMHTKYNSSFLQIFQVCHLYCNFVLSNMNKSDKLHNELLLWAKYESFCNRFTFAKKIVSSYPWYKCFEACRLINELTPKNLITFNEVSTVITPLKKIENIIYSNCKVLYFICCKCFWLWRKLIYVIQKFKT